MKTAFTACSDPSARRRRAAKWHVEIDFGNPELSVLDRDRKIKCECDGPSAAHRRAVDRPNCYLVKMRQ